ncbi:MAG: sigma factor-like helix-turn-helix DNA-binding protein [Solirubrobacteraceae bacterium]
MRVAELNISAAAFACLEAAGITDVDQLINHTADDLLVLPHLGAMELHEIVCQLNGHNLSLPPRSGHGFRGGINPRNREVLRLRIVEGMTFVQIAECSVLSRERVRQILRWNHGLLVQPPAVRARRRREKIRQGMTPET